MQILRYIVLPLFIFSMSVSANEQKQPKQMVWPFDGAFGSFDRQAAQRGFQVYKEVCAACHGLKQLSYRQLNALGFSEAEIKTIAAEYTVIDGPNDEGDMFERAAIPSDSFASPFPNDEAARSSNGGALPPDLSLIVKARADGANYLFSLLTGYHDAPADFKLMEGLHYNPYFAGEQIAMPAPLMEDLVEYQDGTNASVEQMAQDVTIFLQWAAEPEMEHRKSLGIKVMIYLAVFTILFYIVKRRIWAKLK